MAPSTASTLLWIAASIVRRRLLPASAGTVSWTAIGCWSASLVSRRVPSWPRSTPARPYSGPASPCPSAAAVPDRRGVLERRRLDRPQPARLEAGEGEEAEEPGEEQADATVDQGHDGAGQRWTRRMLARAAVGSWARRARRLTAAAWWPAPRWRPLR